VCPLSTTRRLVLAAGTLAAPVAYVTAALPADILYQSVMGDVGAGDAAHGTLPEIYLDRTKKYLVRGHEHRHRCRETLSSLAA